jgi:hypothetical protein
MASPSSHRIFCPCYQGWMKGLLAGYEDLSKCPICRKTLSEKTSIRYLLNFSCHCTVNGIHIEHIHVHLKKCSPTFTQIIADGPIDMSIIVYPKRELDREFVKELGGIVNAGLVLSIPTMCIHCGSNIYGKPKICGECFFVSYCSHYCAVMHREVHEKECEELKKSIV